MTVYELVGKQNCPMDEIGNLKTLLKSSEGDIQWAMVYAYAYGMIQGKREERARRKVR